MIEAALAGETGCRIVLPEQVDPFVFLFSESAGRVLVAVPRTEESRFTAMCRGARTAGHPDRRRRPGADGGAAAVEVQGQFTVTLEELRRTSEGVLPGLFG